MQNSLGYKSLLVALAMTAAASAQDLSCDVDAFPDRARAEAISDRAGDLILQCTAPDEGPDPIITDLTVSLSTTVVNRATGARAGNGRFTDAVLIVNENIGPDDEPLRPTLESEFPPSALHDPRRRIDSRVPMPQFGIVPDNGINTVRWRNVRIPRPRANRDGLGRFPARVTLRITNLRANPSQLGILLSSPEQFFTPPVQFFAAATADGSPVNEDSGIFGDLSRPIQGLVTEFDDIVEAPNCSARGIANGVGVIAEAFSVTLREGFSSAFRSLRSGSALVEADDNFEDSFGGSNLAGVRGADHGTRFALRLFNVPFGLTLGTPGQIQSGGVDLRMVNGADFNGSGGRPIEPTNRWFELGTSGGFATRIYEVVAANAGAVDAPAIPVSVSYLPDLANDVPSVGAMQASVSLAPLSTITQANAAAPVPRFVDTFGDPTTVLFVLRCEGFGPLGWISPQSAVAGGEEFTIFVNGGGFEQGAMILFDGTEIPTTFVSEFELQGTVPAELIDKPGTVEVRVRNANRVRSDPATFEVVPAANGAEQGVGAPRVFTGGFVDAAAFQPIMAPGSIATIFGLGLAEDTAAPDSAAILNGEPLPTQLGGAQVLIGGFEAPLFFVSAGQTNLQIPYELGPLIAAGQRIFTAEVITDAGRAETMVELDPFSPQIFRNPANGDAIVVDARSQLIDENNPARPGEPLVAFVTGLGGLDNPPATGVIAPASPLARTTETAATTVEFAPVETFFSGLSPGFIGLGQVNFRMPEDFGRSGRLRLRLRFDRFPGRAASFWVAE